MEEALRDHRTAPLSDAERALLDFVRRLSREAHAVTRMEVEELKATGWSEEAIYDAITVCALFNFYNVWVDGSGCREHPNTWYRAAAKELVEEGYLHPWTRDE